MNLNDLKPGDQVKIIEGQYKGNTGKFLGIYQSSDGVDHAKISLSDRREINYLIFKSDNLEAEKKIANSAFKLNEKVRIIDSGEEGHIIGIEETPTVEATTMASVYKQGDRVFYNKNVLGLARQIGTVKNVSGDLVSIVLDQYSYLPNDHHSYFEKEIVKVDFAGVEGGARLDSALIAITKLDSESYVFGGFVRDLYAAERFKDLDIFFQDGAKFDAWQSALRSIGFGVTYLRNGFSYGHINQHKVYRINGKDGTTFDVDVIISYTGETNKPMQQSKMDADINSMKMDANFKTAPIFDNAFDVAHSIQNAKDKKFFALGGMRPSRRIKLKGKGFTETTSISTTSTKENTMPTEKEAIASAEVYNKQMAKDEAVDATYRALGRQANKKTRMGIAALLTPMAATNPIAKAVLDQLQTDIGQTGTNALLALIFTAAPGINKNKKVMRFAKEFRTESVAGAEDQLMDLLTALVMPQLKDIIDQLPAFGDEEEETPMRVAAPAPTTRIASPPEEVEIDVSDLTAEKQQAVVR